MYRSLSSRLASLAAVKSGLGVTWDTYATEVGYTTGWQFYTLLGSQPLARAGMLERTALMLVSAGVKSCILFNHEGQFAGSPATVPDIARTMQRIHDQYNGQTMYASGFLSGHQGYSLTSAGTNIIST